MSARLPFGPINDIGRTFAHPQALARSSTLEVDVRGLSSLCNVCVVSERWWVSILVQEGYAWSLRR